MIRPYEVVYIFDSALEDEAITQKLTTMATCHAGEVDLAHFALKNSNLGGLLISLERNQTFVGRTLDVLIEGRGDGISLGRSYRDAPEVDGLVIVEGAVPVGELVPVRITGALEYDLSGVVEPVGEPLSRS